jgi:hypothetical protein
MYLQSCVEQVKNKSNVSDEVINNESDTLKQTIQSLNETMNVLKEQIMEDLIGNYIGWFLPDFKNEEQNGKIIASDEGLYWLRENKINISINKIVNDKIYGHSVVAGNKRPFEGQITEYETTFKIEVKEPGDDQYDGVFSFSIYKNSNKLSGVWNSFKKIDVPKRKYNLEKKIFAYNPELQLVYSRRYGDWEKSKKLHEKEYEEGPTESFSSATEKIYEINASAKLLSKKEIENLKQGDLLIIRNTIYARHGYSFKKRQLRVFFDAQEWYIPYTNDIKKDLTEIEIKNIELLLKYEKNAQEYYDTFGRG